MLILLSSDFSLAAPQHRRRGTGARKGAKREARVFWDLDNISAKNAEHALVIGHRLKRTAERVTGLTPSLTAFANEFTVQRLRSRSSDALWDGALEVLEAELVVAGLEKDAADMLMRRDMLLFAERLGPKAAVVCVSNDQGFGPALERCSRLGAFTVAVGTYLRNSGFNWSQRPGKLPLPAAANAIVAWHPGRAQQHSKQELDLVQDWQQRVLWPADGPPAVLPPEPRRPRVLHAHKGVCATRWLNKDRPLPPELQSVLPGKLAPGGVRCSNSGGGRKGAVRGSAGAPLTTGHAADI